MRRWLAILAVALLGCHEHRFLGPNVPNPNTGGLPQGTDLRLVIGQRVMANEILSVTFHDVPEDSRCPTDVVCVWAGNAAVRLSAALGDGPDIPFTLNTMTVPRDTVFGPFRIFLLALEPEPVSYRPVGRDEYLLTLRFAALPD